MFGVKFYLRVVCQFLKFMAANAGLHSEPDLLLFSSKICLGDIS
jgi:hypothetical protein